MVLLMLTRCWREFRERQLTWSERRAKFSSGPMRPPTQRISFAISATVDRKVVVTSRFDTASFTHSERGAYVRSMRRRYLGSIDTPHEMAHLQVARIAAMNPRHE
jgi:hypothetical protein